jgi:nucleoside-diphosphate-sugar epimerase
LKVLILGCGFTGSRVHLLLKARGIETVCTSRNRSSRHQSGLRLEAEDPASLDQLSHIITAETIVLHSIPVPIAATVFPVSPPARIVYLSTTGVYGTTSIVDEHTQPDPQTARQVLRAAEEEVVAKGPWQSLILRPAAIYGPGRGVHASMREGKYRRFGDGANFVSRIHVDDLARLAEAALLSDLTGAYPVADDEPCTSREIAEYCAGLLGVPMPPFAAPEQLGETRRADRRVDGSAIRRRLSLKLRYPNYRSGIAACLAEEARALSTS